MLIAGHYEVLRTLGRGGMSTVFLARDARTDERVALKVLDLPEPDDVHDADDREQYMRRFFSELVLTSRVNHPNVVQIFDFGVENERGQPFIVMERLDGMDLETALARRLEFDAHRTLRLFGALLEALAELHDSGIVHKDIKPANLFLHRPGEPEEVLVLTDFGIAHRLRSTRATQTGLVACTPRYGAPEYLLGNVISPAMDVYQVGLVLLETLTGVAVVDEPTPFACMIAHCDGRLNIPWPLLMGPLGEVLKGALHIDPAMRFANAGAMLEELSAVDPRALDLSLQLLDELNHARTSRLHSGGTR